MQSRTKQTTWLAASLSPGYCDCNECLQNVPQLFHNSTSQPGRFYHQGSGHQGQGMLHLQVLHLVILKCVAISLSSLSSNPGDSFITSQWEYLGQKCRSCSRWATTYSDKCSYNWKISSVIGNLYIWQTLINLHDKIFETGKKDVIFLKCVPKYNRLQYIRFYLNYAYFTIFRQT